MSNKSVSNCRFRCFGGCFFGIFFRFFLFFRCKKLVENQHKDTDGDGGVGEVENGVEEGEILSAHKRHPLGPCDGKERKIEHVNHLAVKERRITAPFGEHRGHLSITFAEHQSVETAVEDVANGSGKHQGETDYKELARVLFYKVYDKPRYAHRGHETENGQLPDPIS